MRNQFRAALIVDAIVLAVALVFSIAYFALGLYHASRVLDVLLVAVWVLFAAFLLVVYRLRMTEREKLMRRFYLSPKWIYNHEIGYAPLMEIVPDADVYEFVTFAAESLARMSYGFEVAEAPSEFAPEYMISSNRFEYHLVGEGDDPEDKSVVIDEWSGTLQQITTKPNGSHAYTQVGTYSNARELAILLFGIDDVREGSLAASGQVSAADDEPLPLGTDDADMLSLLDGAVGGTASAGYDAQKDLLDFLNAANGKTSATLGARGASGLVAGGLVDSANASDADGASLGDGSSVVGGAVRL